MRLLNFFMYRAIYLFTEKNVGNLFLQLYLNQSNDADKCQSHSFFILSELQIAHSLYTKKKCVAKIASHELPCLRVEKMLQLHTGICNI